MASCPVPRASPTTARSRSTNNGRENGRSRHEARWLYRASAILQRLIQAGMERPVLSSRVARAGGARFPFWAVAERARGRKRQAAAAHARFEKGGEPRIDQDEQKARSTSLDQARPLLSASTIFLHTHSLASVPHTRSSSPLALGSSTDTSPDRIRLSARPLSLSSAPLQSISQPNPKDRTQSRPRSPNSAAAAGFHLLCIPRRCLLSSRPPRAVLSCALAIQLRTSFLSVSQASPAIPASALLSLLYLTSPVQFC